MSPLAAFALPAALTGAAFGSWLATARVRRLRGEAAWRGRSRCDHCGVGLNYAQTLPVASYILSGGRCRTCGGAIDLRHPLYELVGAVSGAVLVLGLIHG